mmetsp:Transcript_43362/g.97888  ORF Transcript_43362/g.97888 Transcript_43362/m.97888 type:complete len:409 (-) Transcript_43362:70-1296(-)
MRGKLDLQHCSEGSCVVRLPNYRERVGNVAKGQYLEAADFLNIGGVKFALRVYPKGDVDADDGQVSLCLETYAPERGIVLHAVFSIVDAEESMALRSSTIWASLEEPSDVPADEVFYHGWMHFCKASEIEEGGYLSDGVLRVRVKVKFVEKERVCHPNAPSVVIKDMPDHVEKLIKDLKEMLDVGDGDVVLVADGEEHVAHRAILKARSPVFRAMFGAPMAEGHSGRVVIEDLDADTVSGFVQFLYTAELPDSALEGDDSAVETLVKLVRAADKYEVNSLVDICVDELKHWMTTRNVLKSLMMAHTFRNQALKTACLGFATRDEQTVRALHDMREFDELGADLVRELFVFAHGTGKRRMTGAFEFPNGSDWTRLSNAQLQRACDERQLLALGERRELLARLELAVAEE